MKLFQRAFQFLLDINLNTIRFNLKYLPLKQALHFPVMVSKYVKFAALKGQVVVEGSLQRGMVKIGYGHVGIFDKKCSPSILELHGLLVFKCGAEIGHGSKLSIASGATLVLGSNFTITAESSIICTREVVIGDNVLVSWESLIIDTDYHTIKDGKNNTLNGPQPIYIGENVWLGMRCLVLKGSVVPNGSVIGANSLVNKKLTEEHSLYGGSPVKLLRTDITWHR